MALTGGLCACSSDSGILGSNLTTSSVNTTAATAPVAQAPKVDPACTALAARIDALRKDGVTERVEKASVGTTPNVSVKRASLAQIAELDRANAEFQAKCSTLGPRPLPVQAQVAPATPAATSSSAVVTARSTSAVVPPVVTTQATKQ